MDKSLTLFDIVGGSVFNKWIKGIGESKIILLFWSHAFKQDRTCLYQAEQAVMKARLTKGRHIVISVVIDSCKVPERYKLFDCAYAWLLRKNLPKALQNVLKYVIGMLII